MLSLTSGCGRPIAEVKGGKDAKKILSVIDPDKSDNCCALCSPKCNRAKVEERCCDKCKSCCKKKEAPKPKEETIGQSYVCDTDGRLSIIPNIKEREITYIAGPSGSGKSTIASKYVEMFKELFPDRDFFLFSRLDKDPALDRLKPMRIMIDENLLRDPIDIQTELSKGAILVFDDCSTIQNPALKRYIDGLMSDIMEIGRKLNIWLVITNHLVIPNEKKMARTIMNEMHSMTVFPKSGSAQQIRYALKTYFGLTNKQIDEIIKMPSRWITVYKSYPQYVLYDKGSFILN